jgi:hypothetical protein
MDESLFREFNNLNGVWRFIEFEPENCGEWKDGC